MYRYLLIYYEKLVTDRNPTLDRIYQFIGLPLTRQVEKFIWWHTHFKGKSKPDYYATYVKKNFKHDSWKYELKPEVREGGKIFLPGLKLEQYQNDWRSSLRCKASSLKAFLPD